MYITQTMKWMFADIVLSKPASAADAPVKFQSDTI